MTKLGGGFLLPSGNILSGSSLANYNSGWGENENLCGNDIMFSLRQIEDNKYFSLGR